MVKEEKLFREIGTNLKGVAMGQMFGMPIIKVNGKALAGLHGKAMVFKLTGETHASALKLKGAQLFEPMKGRPMKEWVVLPATHNNRWEEFAKSALAYVRKKAK
ncbi:MAG: hypothetical protein HY064_04495 [Bacteroidetes bacterium]|nr:hypothetical protein [Bacteroidota bacterium]